MAEGSFLRAVGLPAPIQSEGRVIPAPIVPLMGANPFKDMIQNTIKKIETEIETSPNLTPERRRELVALLNELRDEVNELAKTDDERARSIATFADASTHEALRTERNPELVDLSLQGLSSSVKEFENTHPRLVQVVNSVCHTLSNMGI